MADPTNGLQPQGGLAGLINEQADRDPVIAQKLNALSPQERQNLPLLTYKNLAGETEARNVESRLNLTPQQRYYDKTPWSTQDVPFSQQIVRLLSK